jgi:hypothetical protein
MHDQELLRRAQYDQDNGPPDDLYVIPVDHAPSASPGAVNNKTCYWQFLSLVACIGEAQFDTVNSLRAG